MIEIALNVNISMDESFSQPHLRGIPEKGLGSFGRREFQDKYGD
jgi:hypothetical protein